FIPFDEEHFDEEGQVRPEAKAIPLNQVQAHRDYALLITTCSGAWRYLIGDTVRFEDLAHLEIRITGRIKHFLSLCGEHLSMENINESLLKLAQDEDLTMGECAVMGLSSEAGYGHRWYLSVAADQVDSVRLRQEALLTKLDNILCILNDDYEVERRHALARMEIVVLSEDIPLQWMSTLNKLGGQHKFPRVLKGKYAESWLDFVRETTPVSLPLRSNR
ncbi:MAG: GH3 auxin-responsive promoter family protein, partial [Bacteroidota bacterium]